MEKAASSIQENQQLVELASVSAVEPSCLVVHSELELPNPYDVLSDDEGDSETLQRNSLSKVTTRDDGSRQLVNKHATKRRAREKSLSEMNVKEAQPHTNPAIKPESTLQTIQPFKNSPLKGMVLIEPTKTSCDSPALSFPGLPGLRQPQTGANGCQGPRRLYTEAVTRTPSPDANTVTVSSLPRRRRGRRGQLSYFDVTAELHYPR